MNLFYRVWSFFVGNAITQKKGKQARDPSGSPYSEKKTVDIDSALQVSTVWACVTLLVETISSLPLITSIRTDDKTTIDKQSRIYKIFHDSPNKRQTAQEFWEQMLLGFFLRGNAYARILRDARGEVVSLWPLSADQVDVVVAEDGNLTYVYSFDKTSIAYNESDIFHIRGMGNGSIGLSPLDYMQSSVGLAISAQDHTAKTLSKDARRPGVLMTDSVLTPEQRASLKSTFGDIVSGNGNELYILEAAMKFQPLGMSPADIQLLETRKFSVQDLARWFGVPSVLINDTGESSSLGSSVEQIINSFYRLKLRPQLERIEQVIQQRVFTANQRSKGMQIEFNLDALLRASAKDRMEIHAKAVQNGLATRNERRSLENQEPLPGGDVLTAQVNLMPVEMLGQQTTQGGTVPPETVEQ